MRFGNENSKMIRLRIETVCGAALLIAAAVVVASRGRRREVPLPEVPVASPAEVRVKAVERKAEPVEQGKAALASGAVAIVCGMDEATADRYEARNDALRSIARRRDLPKDDVEALLAYLRSQDDAARVGGRGAPALPDGGVRGVLVKAASDKTKPYAGTALYSLAEDSRTTRAHKAATKRGPPVLRTGA